MDVAVVVSCLLLVAILMVQGISGTYIPDASPDNNGADGCPKECFCHGEYMHCEYHYSSYSVKILAPSQPTSLKFFGVKNIPMPNKLISLKYVPLKIHDGQIASAHAVRDVFYRVRNLNISSIPINAIERDDFVLMRGLIYLTVVNSGIQEIGLHAFADLSQLRELNLNGNRLTSLNSGMFTGLERLKRLQMDGNALVSLSDNVFGMLHSLGDLSLNKNSLTYIDGLFNNLTALLTLDVGENEITSIQNDTVGYLLTVENVYLGKNPFHCSCISGALISAVQHNTSIDTHDMTCAGPPSVAGNSFLNLTIGSMPCESARVVEISPSSNILQQGNVELKCLVTGSYPVGIYWLTPWGDKFTHSSTQAKFPAETKNAVQEKDIGSNVLITTKLYVTRDGALHIDKFRGTFAGDFTCVSVNELGESNSTVSVGIASVVKDIYIASIFIGTYCASSLLGLAIILGAIRYFVNKCLHKEGCHCCCCRSDDNEADSVKFEEEVIEVTYSTGSQDTDSYHDFDSEFPPTDPPVNSPLRRKSPEKCRTPPDDFMDLEKDSPHIWEQLDEVRSRLRLGAGRKIEKVRSHVRSFTDTGTLKIREMKDAGSMKIQSIKETSSHAASRVRKNVASGMVQVKYGVQSIKEFCGTGEMGTGTISMVSVSTDVDTTKQVKIIRSHTFV